MRIGVLTSTDIRHRYFARRLREATNVVAVAYEQTGYVQADVRLEELTDSERRIVETHFAERSRQERRYFGARAEFLETDEACAACHLEPGSLNTQQTLSALQNRGVEAVAVFGTNLIKTPLIDAWRGRMVNMHLGLSPYYRGTATNFYPLLNEEPEYVGATIHMIDPGIDSGAILRHARPVIEADDMPHTIGCKTIIAGIDAMIDVLGRLAAGTLRPVPQWAVKRPRLYLRKNYHPRQVVELYQKLDAGLIPDYVARAADVRDRIRLVE